MSTVADTAKDTLVERFGLKALVESCLVLEEGVAGTKDVDIGMMAGAGIMPGPLSRADEQGLDEVLEALERARVGVGRGLHAARPPAPARGAGPARAGSRARASSPTRSADDGQSRETVQLETRGDVAIVWLNRPPANPLSPQLMTRARRALAGARRQRARGRDRVLQHLRLLGGRGHQGVHQDGSRQGGRRAARGGARADAVDGALVHGHDRLGQLARLRRRLRARDGVRLPDRRRVRDVRAAGDQPGDHPRLRRHAAAAAARRRGQGARDEPRRGSDRRRRGAPVGPREPDRARPRAVRRLAGLGAQDGRAGAARGRADQVGVAPRRSRRGAQGGGGGLRDGLRLGGRQGGHLGVPRRSARPRFAGK